MVKDELLELIHKRRANIAIIGMGYVGLPLAITFANAGFNVTGIDPIQEKVDMLNRGESYILDISNAQVRKHTEAGRLRATTDYSILTEIDAVSICVPTPLRKTGDPDLSFIASASESLAPYLHRGMVIVLESSTYPGTTRELVLPKLSECCGLKVGEDFFLAFSPERVDPGRTDFTTYNTPKVVGGITPACTEVSAAWYAQALETIVPVSTTEVAEMTKLLENTFRMVNISMVNELAQMCDRLGIDVWEVIDAAATKPFGFMKFTPGPGMGGHCIPVDPLYLSWKMKSINYTARFIDLASEIDSNMPRYVVSKIQDALNRYKKPLNGSKVLILGVAYKPNVNDLRESPAFDVIHLLQEKGALVSYYDPYVPEVDYEFVRMTSEKDLAAAVEKADLVAIITNHTKVDYNLVFEKAQLIFDARNALKNIAKKSPKVVKL
ncbi:MAG: nucleotide sugar dehydrogenase [Chloroflexi bacterium]|jgi:UDP-N-acetyl-D-glucosamine dehydrogenase|nr:nucleotide sugar dehydrogenase [Anaerolineaceae bacterium]NLI44916.1 nucleotide sugar dehydrogenase [Chloroflexota bacterium]HOE34931.1 nucleotide sugar dehydrogenase [Anaerolineaceae bacterium]HOT26195.1 nucleotide sugar dehydrogenase [Anaerolineaceae bacterium]HQK03840.1 nucleotide sugar dehydrogenase [Anaerolineaceae bacterium]